MWKSRRGSQDPIHAIQESTDWGRKVTDVFSYGGDLTVFFNVVCFFLVGWKDIFLSLLRSNHQRYKLFTACRMLYIFVFFLNSLQFHTFGISAIAILDKQILSVFFLQATEWVFYLIWFCWYWLGLSPSHKCQSKNIWLDHFRTRGPCQILSSSKKSRIWALI